ncbi:rhamnan synthesis F family protein [Variovorax sp. V213]|uniref:rhamnosyltransferase WsaF family glycosyltransferase n=1 Tax=Variovorax sp. V213 TaxID=3065955 RepID=UPI0034E8647D
MRRVKRVADRFWTEMRQNGFLWACEFSLAELRRRRGLKRAPQVDHLPQRPSTAVTDSQPVINAQGIVNAIRPDPRVDFSIAIPFDAEIASTVEHVAVVAHLYYEEYASEIFGLLKNFPVRYSLFISVANEAGKLAVQEAIGESGLLPEETVIRIFPNKGRDIAPKIVGFADVYGRFEYVLHIHSKRSPHNGVLNGWRSHLLDHLLGSPEIVRSNLALLSRPNMGMVFPMHFKPVRGSLNWGYDFPLARELLQRAGIVLSRDLTLEFPSGSMFWARSSALRKLLALNLSFDDFGTEQGLVDGTLAHAIERSYLVFVEAAGFKWAKVSRRASAEPGDQLLDVYCPDDIDLGVKLAFRSIHASSVRQPRLLEQRFGEIRPLRSYFSDVARPRLNLLIPTINPHQTFGGVATALRVFRTISERLGREWDFRLVVTDAPITSEARLLFEDYVFAEGDTMFDSDSRSIVDATPGINTSVSLRAGDHFMASAWWNATQGLDLRDLQRDFYSGHCSFIYLIQDFEPGFYPWSSRWGLAESTYLRLQRDIAIINSQQLYDYFAAHYRTGTTYLLPYEPNAQIVAAQSPRKRRNLIIFYGRPSVPRNGFELIVDGIRLWQARFPDLAAQWEIVSIGEDMPEGISTHLLNARVSGKLSLAAYGELLSEAAVGVSIMMSPHPSYPPLEMTAAGVWTITNKFTNKDLSQVASNVVNVDALDPHGIAKALTQAIGNFVDGRTDALQPGSDETRLASSDAVRFDAEQIARSLDEELHARLVESNAFGRARNWRVEASSFQVVKKLPDDRSEVALFVTHRPRSLMKPHIAHYLRSLRQEGISVILIIAADDVSIDVPDEILTLVDGAVMRANEGFDFAAWAHVLKSNTALFNAKILYLLNDSLVGPFETVAFENLIQKIRLSTSDLVGLVDNHEVRWHLQSFFVALKPRALQSPDFRDFVNRIESLATKDEVIQSYELGLTDAMLRSGLKIEALFPSTSDSNRTVHQWRELLFEGMPFAKFAMIKQFGARATELEFEGVIHEAKMDSKGRDLFMSCVRSEARDMEIST